MAAPELIIFDCDGVLVDSEFIAAQAEVDLLREHGYENDVKEHIRRFTGLNTVRTIKIIEQESGRYFPDDLDAKIGDEIDSRLWRGLKPVNGIHAALDQLDQPRCICSNSSDGRLKMSLTKTELWDRFRPYVFSATSLENVKEKPAPDVYLHAARKFEVAANQCVVIEDSAHGVEGGVAAGMRVIGFTGASHTYSGHSEQLMDAGAETIIRHLGELVQVIEAFSAWEGLPG